MASNISICNDSSDITDLCPAQGLYLKSITKVTITVSLPMLKLPGKTVSTIEIQEELKRLFLPDQFLSFKVVKTTTDTIRYECEVENKAFIASALNRLDGKFMKLISFSEKLKIRCAEAKIQFSSRQDWDDFFRNSNHMDEMKPGERPDTIHLQHLPSLWFVDFRDGSNSKPSELILTRVFEAFGTVRTVDIPMLAPSENDNKEIQTFNFNQNSTFEAYVQYAEYVSFVKCMNALKGMKLVYKNVEQKMFMTNIKVDFDKTKYMTDPAIRIRKLEREKLKKKEDDNLEKVILEREKAINRVSNLANSSQSNQKYHRDEREVKRLERRIKREKLRRIKRVENKEAESERLHVMKEEMEFRRILLAQRKLESLRLLSYLFDRIKNDKISAELEAREKDLENQRETDVKIEKRRLLLEEKEKLKKEEERKRDLQKEEKKLRKRILSHFNQDDNEKSSKSPSKSRRVQVKPERERSPRVSSRKASRNPRRRQSPDDRYRDYR